MKNYEVIILGSFALVAYWYTGVLAWSQVLAFSEDLELMATAELTIWGKIGSTVMILLWPVWAVPLYLVRAGKWAGHFYRQGFAFTRGEIYKDICNGLQEQRH